MTLNAKLNAIGSRNLVIVQRIDYQIVIVRSADSFHSQNACVHYLVQFIGLIGFIRSSTTSPLNVRTIAETK